MVITLSPARKGRFNASLGSRLLCSSDTPFLDAARVLLQEGVDPATPLEAIHESDGTIGSRSTVGAAARLAVVENNRVGPVFRPYKAFPASLRPQSRENAACA